MNLLSEKAVRTHALFLSIFSLLLLALTILGSVFFGGQIRSLLYARELALVSSLLDQGVQPSVLADALKNPSGTESGRAFLSAAGRTEQTALWLLPSSRSMILHALRIMLPAALLLICLLLAGSFFFWQSRQQMYLHASGIIQKYAEGDFSVRLPRGETGALCQLFRSADSLATALQARIQSEHKSREFLKESVSDISHQLKTPLAALRLYMDILSGEPDNPETVRRFTARSIQSVSRMESLIQTLLKLMRLDTGNVAFQLRPHSVKELMEEAAQDLLVRAVQEQKQLLIEGDPHEMLICDAGWLSEAFGNLIKNALDHTRAGGAVKVSWQRSPVLLRIFVQDNGCGIPPEDIHHIFKRFYRSSRDRNTPGIGLGLPLAKSVIEGQGGTLTVQSTPGEGSVFTASFLTKL